MQLDTYIISLKSSINRRESLLKQCLNFPELNPIVFDAISGLSLNYDIAIKNGYNKKRRNKMYNDLELNEIACLMSHKEVLNKFLISKEKFCLILEDDAFLSEDSIKTINYLIEKVHNWDIIKLECREKKLRGQIITTFLESKKLYIPTKSSLGTTAILYSKKGAEKVRNSLNDFSFAFDTHLGLIQHSYNISIAQVFPSVIYESQETVSTIGVRKSKKNSKKGFLPYIRRRFLRISNSIIKRIVSNKYKNSIYVK